MNLKKYFLLIGLALVMVSCESFLDVNDNPNQLTEIPSGDLLLKGTMLANTQLHKGHLMRSAMYYSGQLIGKQLVQQTIYTYQFTPGDSDGSWSHLYNGILTQNKEIRRISPELDLLQGIIDVNEAMAIGTAATLWGDIPYSTAVPDNPGLEADKPTYDSQIEVYNTLQTKLDDAIERIGDARTSVGSVDIFYGGNKDKWIEAAYTLKARYALLSKDYDLALDFVDKGISSPANTLSYNPVGEVDGNSNLLYLLVEGSRAGDMTGEGSFIRDLMDPDTTISRNNTKTNEMARRNYYYINGDGASANGIDSQAEPMPLVSYSENLLIWAECLLRSGEEEMAINKLNEWRTYLNSGEAFNLTDPGDTYLYANYDLSDFESGGMENLDGIDRDRAILREIIEERYVSGFTTYMPFNDVRRLRKTDSDVMVPFGLNTSTATMNPQRLLYPRAEIESNANVPSPLPDLFTVTRVNE